MWQVSLEEVLKGETIVALTVSPSNQLVLARTDQHLAVYDRSKEKVLAHFVRPQEVSE